MSQGTVVALFRKVSEDLLEPVESLKVVADKGIEGDIYFGWDERQVLFLSTEDLNAFGYKAGDFREQVTVEFSGLQQLEPGTPVQVGSVPCSVEQDCPPCASLAKRMGEEPVAFVKKTLRRRGMFLRPLGSGELRVGDTLTVGGA